MIFVKLVTSPVVTSDIGNDLPMVTAVDISAVNLRTWTTSQGRNYSEMIEHPVATLTPLVAGSLAGKHILVSCFTGLEWKTHLQPADDDIVLTLRTGDRLEAIIMEVSQ